MLFPAVVVVPAGTTRVEALVVSSFLLSFASVTAAAASGTTEGSPAGGSVLLLLASCVALAVAATEGIRSSAVAVLLPSFSILSAAEVLLS